MDNFQIAMSLDLKQFYAALQTIEGVSQETVNELQQMFSKVETVQVPFDGKRLQEELDKVTKSTVPVVTGMNRAAQSTLSLNYIIRDSPFFFQRFDMGIMAVSNNLNPFIDQMLKAKQETGSWKGAITTLTSGLVGIGGLSVAFSLIVAAVQAYSFWATNAARETSGVKNEVKGLNDEIKKMYDEQMKNERNLAKVRLWELQRQYPEGVLKKLDPDTRQMVSRPKTEPERYGPAYEEVKSLEKKIQLYSKELNSLGEIENIERRIALNTNQRKELNQQNYKSYVSQATSLKDAQNIMQKWIDNDKKLIEIEKDKKEKSLFTTDAEIRAEIKKINTLLAGNITAAEYIRLLDLRNTKVKELTVVTEDLIKAEDKRNKNRTDKEIKNSLKGPFTVQPIEVIKPQPFKESNDELQRMLDLSNMLTTSFNRAGQAVTSAAVSGINLFRIENSLLQIFINNLIRAAAEALILKGITTALNFIGGLFGAPSFGSAVGLAATAAGSNAPLINPGGSGLSNVNLSRSAASFRGGTTNISPIIQQVPIVLDTRIKRKDIYLTQRKHQSDRRKYYGASDG